MLKEVKNEPDAEIKPAVPSKGAESLKHAFIVGQILTMPSSVSGGRAFQHTPQYNQKAISRATHFVTGVQTTTNYERQTKGAYKSDQQSMPQCRNLRTNLTKSTPPPEI